MCRHTTADQQREGWRAVIEMARGLRPLIIRVLALARRRGATLRASG